MSVKLSILSKEGLFGKHGFYNLTSWPGLCCKTICYCPRLLLGKRNICAECNFFWISLDMLSLKISQLLQYRHRYSLGPWTRYLVRCSGGKSANSCTVQLVHSLGSKLVLLLRSCHLKMGAPSGLSKRFALLRRELLRFLIIIRFGYQTNDYGKIYGPLLWPKSPGRVRWRGPQLAIALYNSTSFP